MTTVEISDFWTRERLLAHAQSLRGGGYEVAEELLKSLARQVPEPIPTEAGSVIKHHSGHYYVLVGGRWTEVVSGNKLLVKPTGPNFTVIRKGP